MLGQLYSSVRQRPVAAWQCGQSGFDKGIRRCLNRPGTESGRTLTTLKRYSLMARHKAALQAQRPGTEETCGRAWQAAVLDPVGHAVQNSGHRAGRRLCKIPFPTCTRAPSQFWTLWGRRYRASRLGWGLLGVAQARLWDTRPTSLCSSARMSRLPTLQEQLGLGMIRLSALVPCM